MLNQPGRGQREGREADAEPARQGHREGREAH